MDIDHESLYLTELIYLRHGRPVWEPNPDTLYDRVRIGDVGYFQNGKFVPIFNILPHANNPNRRLPFPQPNFPPLHLIGNLTHRTNPLAGVYALESRLTFSVSGGIESPGSVLHGETFLSFTDEKGAALILPYKAQREDAVNSWPFKRHMLNNYRKWANFAETTCQLEKGTRLVLVTGCDLTRQWATATYFRNNRELTLGGGGGVASVASAHFSLSAGWRINQAINTRQGPPEDQEVDEPLGDNQCVFLRGFYVKERFLLGPKILKAGAGYHDLGERKPEEGEGKGWLADEDITMESFSPPTQDETLIVVLLDYMLEESNADIVIAHDSDLWPYLQGTPSRENLRETLKKMSPYINIEGGVGSLVDIDSASIMLTPAHRIDLDAKSRASVRVGYERLGSRTYFMGKDLHKCVAVIHRDILLMWSDYPQPDMFQQRSFRVKLSKLAEDLADTEPSPNDDVIRNTTNIAGAAGAITAIDAVFANPVDYIVGPIDAEAVFAKWVEGVYRDDKPAVLRCLMAYIVDLIIIIRTIVVISEARHKFVWPEEIEDVLRRFEANQRNEIHAEIRSFVQEMGVLQAIAGPKAIVLEKMVELVDSRGASAEDSST